MRWEIKGFHLKCLGIFSSWRQPCRKHGDKVYESHTKPHCLQVIAAWNSTISKKAEPWESPMASRTTLTNCPPPPQLGLICYGSIPPFSGQQMEICKVRTFWGERGRKVPYKPLLQWPATHSLHHLPSLPVSLEAVFGNNTFTKGFPTGSERKQPACNARDTGDPSSISGSGRSPGGRYGNPLQYSCPKNPTDRGAWQAAVLRVTKSLTQLSN